MPDVRRAVTMDVKQPGDLVFVLGETRAELGGSEYYAMHGAIGNRVPHVAAARARVLYEALSQAIQRGLVSACHDCSDGASVLPPPRWPLPGVSACTSTCVPCRVSRHHTRRYAALRRDGQSLCRPCRRSIARHSARLCTVAPLEKSDTYSTPRSLWCSVSR